MKDPIDVILQNEGGYVNASADRGGPTNFGITQATYSVYLGHPASIDDVKAMPVEAAREIYERQYLSGPRIDQLSDPIKTQVLDIAVNSGPTTAIKMIQRVVNAAGFGPVTVDGVLGPFSRTAIETAQTKMGKLLNNALVDERINFFNAIVEHNMSQHEFIHGWLNRANSFRIA